MQLDLEVLKKIRLADANIESSFKKPDDTWNLMFNLMKKEHLQLSKEMPTLQVPPSINLRVSDIIGANLNPVDDHRVVEIGFKDAWQYKVNIFEEYSLYKLSQYARTSYSLFLYYINENGEKQKYDDCSFKVNCRRSIIERHQASEAFAFLAFLRVAERLQLILRPGFSESVYRKDGRWFLKMLSYFYLLHSLNEDFSFQPYDITSIEKLEYVVEKEIDTLKHLGQIVKLEIPLSRQIFIDSEKCKYDIYIASFAAKRIALFNVDGILYTRTMLSNFIDTEFLETSENQFVVNLIEGAVNPEFCTSMYNSLNENVLIPLSFIKSKNRRELETFIANSAYWNSERFSLMIYNLHIGLSEVPTAAGTGFKGRAAITVLQDLYTNAYRTTNKLVGKFTTPLSTNELNTITDSDIAEFCRINNIADHPLIASIKKEENSSGLRVVLKEDMKPELIQKGGKMFRVDPGVMNDFTVRSFTVSFDGDNRFSNVTAYKDENFSTISKHPNVSSQGTVCLGDLTNETFVNFEGFVNMLRQVNLDSAYRRTVSEILNEWLRADPVMQGHFNQGQLHKIPGIYSINNRVI